MLTSSLKALYYIYLIFIPIVVVGFKESKISKTIFWKEKKFIFTNYVSTLVGVFGKDIDKFIIPAILGIATLGQFSLSVQIFSTEIVSAQPSPSLSKQ